MSELVSNLNLSDFKGTHFLYYVILYLEADINTNSTYSKLVWYNQLYDIVNSSGAKRKLNSRR